MNLTLKKHTQDIEMKVRMKKTDDKKIIKIIDKSMRKLYITLEENDMLKVERVIVLDEYQYDKSIMEVIHDMEDSLNKVKEESDKNIELINDVKAQTQHND